MDMIASVEQAFEILDTQQEGVPYEAIEYLRNVPSNKLIEEKIIDALLHAYDDIWYCEAEGTWYHAPLWYAIVAETHLSPSLIEPVISLFTQTDHDWDALNEQGAVLVCLLSEVYPLEMMHEVSSSIDAMLRLRSKAPYLFLFDAFFYANVDRYKLWFLKTLADERLEWVSPFAWMMVDLQIKEALPILKRRLAKATELDKADIADAVKQLETGTNFYPDQAHPWSQVRGDWKAFYKKHERMFYPEDPKSHAQPALPETVKIGRNDLCPCGSGKKYKKCCLLKIN